MSTKLKGHIVHANDTKQITPKFKKKEVVLKVEGAYKPQFITIEFNNANIEKIESYNVDEVEISVNINGRQWESPQGEVKYFNSIEGWAVSNPEAAVSVEEHLQVEDDLPF